MHIRLSGRDLAIPFPLAALASGLLLWGTVSGTLFWRSFAGDWNEAPRWARLLSYTDLANENVIGSWFSSMLLALIAWVAVLCFVVDGAAGRRDWLRYGWLTIALGFAALSFDELGSIHERLHLPDNLSGQVLWYAPVMVLLPAYMLVFGLSRMRGDRVAFGMALLGALCFASIPLQEYFEIAVRHGAGTVRPVSEIALEEGTELLGMLLFLAAFVRYCRRAMRGRGKTPQTNELSRGVAIGVWVAIFAVGLITRDIASSWLQPDALSGNPRNWFPAFAAFLVACLAWHAPVGTRGARAIAAVVCIGLSMLAGSQTPHGEWLLALGGLDAEQSRALITTTMLAAGSAIILANRRASPAGRWAPA